MTHWTRYEIRLSRKFGSKRFDNTGYAMEELVAEIGAAFLCSDLGIIPETRKDHAAYVASWLKALKNDKRAISPTLTTRNVLLIMSGCRGKTSCIELIKDLCLKMYITCVRLIHIMLVRQDLLGVR